MADSVKINKSFVDRAEKPVGKDQVFYRDKELKGFALRVTSAGTKSFIVEKIIGKKVRRITLGKYGSLTAETARTKAKILLGKLQAAATLLLRSRPQKCVQFHCGRSTLITSKPASHSNQKQYTTTTA